MWQFKIKCELKSAEKWEVNKAPVWKPWQAFGGGVPVSWQEKRCMKSFSSCNSNKRVVALSRPSVSNYSVLRTSPHNYRICKIDIISSKCEWAWQAVITCPLLYNLSYIWGNNTLHLMSTRLNSRFLYKVMAAFTPL